MLEINAIPKMPPENFLRGLSNEYHSANRGPNIGDWKDITEEEKHFVMENSTAHNCALEEGVLLGGIVAFGGKIPRIKQISCVKNREPVCLFDITWL